MAQYRAAAPGQAAFLHDLTAAGLLIESGVAGIYGRGPVFEDVRLRVDELISRHAVEDAEQLRFGPVLPRRQLEAAGYLRSFPHLTASIFGFDGDDGQAGELATCGAAHEPWGH